MSTESNWAGALLSPEQPVPAGLKTWNHSAPETRFAVYRNNVLVSLITALAETFPVTRRLVGDDFFRTMAAEFVRNNPPKSAVLADYGGGFPDFVAAYPHVRTLPYLADMTRLELAYLQAYHAADAPAIDGDEITALLASPEFTARARFNLHPSLRTLRSRYAVISLWAAHQGHGELSAVSMAVAENGWLLRCGLQVAVFNVSAGDCHFVEKLRSGCSLQTSANSALESDPNFDLSTCLAVMLREGAIVSVK